MLKEFRPIVGLLILCGLAVAAFAPPARAEKASAPSSSKAQPTKPTAKPARMTELDTAKLHAAMAELANVDRQRAEFEKQWQQGRKEYSEEVEAILARYKLKPADLPQFSGDKWTTNVDLKTGEIKPRPQEQPRVAQAAPPKASAAEPKPAPKVEKKQ